MSSGPPAVLLSPPFPPKKMFRRNLSYDRPFVHAILFLYLFCLTSKSLLSHNAGMHQGAVLLLVTQLSKEAGISQLLQQDVVFPVYPDLHAFVILSFVYLFKVWCKLFLSCLIVALMHMFNSRGCHLGAWI